MSSGKRNLRSATRPIYSNWSALHPDGTLIFRCGDRRAKWYLSSGLAEKVGEKTLQLLFEPNGYGHANSPTALFHLSEKECRCVACGVEEDLTRHHIVPRTYRKHFPDRYKKGECHDILPLCVNCHEKYEDHADDLKKLISDTYNVPLCGEKIEISNRAKDFAVRYAKTLMIHRDDIPEAKCQGMLDTISEYLGRPPTQEDIEELAKISRESCHGKTHGQMVAELLNTEEKIYDFIVKWREHFVQKAEPKYLPKGWSIYSAFKNE